MEGWKFEMVIFDLVFLQNDEILTKNGIKNNIFLNKIILYKITYKMLFYSLYASSKITSYENYNLYKDEPSLHRYFWPSMAI